MKYPALDRKLFSSNLRLFREKIGLTQNQVAGKLGVQAGTVSDYERGRVNLPIDKVIELANLYNCSIDTILGFENVIGEENPKFDIGRTAPLVALGLFGNKFHSFENEIVSDPAIMLHLGINKVEERSNLFLRVIEKLTQPQQHLFTVELLKYLYSLIAADKAFATEEVVFFEFVQKQLIVTPSEEELKAIKRAGTLSYLGGSLKKAFPTESLRRFSVWIMNIMAHVDREYHPLEKEYIAKVASHFGLSEATQKFIEDGVIQGSKRPFGTK